MRYEFISAADPSIYIPREMSHFMMRPATFDTMCDTLRQFKTHARTWTLQKWMLVFVEDNETLNYVTPADSIQRIIYATQKAFTGSDPSIIFVGSDTEEHDLIRVLWDPQNNTY